jgi:hypothetical protein
MSSMAALQEKRPRRVVRSAAPRLAGGPTLDVQGRKLAISHLDKVFYPKTGFTKGQIIDY